MHRFRFIPSMRSLIWAFDLHSYILKYPMILLADSVCPCQTMQADLDLLCPHMCRLIWVYDAHLAHAVRLTQGYSIMQGFVSTSCQPYSLTLCILGKMFSRRHFEIFFFIFPRKKIDISCKLSLMVTVCMKCRNLLMGKIRKISFVCRLLNLSVVW